jgi:hypothetical protein
MDKDGIVPNISNVVLSHAHFVGMANSVKYWTPTKKSPMDDFFWMEILQRNDFVQKHTTKICHIQNVNE